MDLEELKLLSALKYQKSQKELSVMIAHETELRNELLRLRNLVIETHTAAPKDSQLRAIGADVIWLKWIGGAQRKLNITLAQLLARKEAHITLNRRDHGKKIVADRLAHDHADAKNEKRRANQLRTAIEQTLFQQPR